MEHRLVGIQAKTMSSTLEKAIERLSDYAVTKNGGGIDSCVMLLTVVAYLATVLSVPILDPGRLVWMFCFPIIMAEATGIGYGRVFTQSLIVLPLVALIGIFNPIIDKAAFCVVGGVTISRGWVSLLSIILRGLLSFQALIILVRSTGFTQICAAMQGLRVPSVLVTQLYMLYRYCGVIMEEALSMQRARAARGFGRPSYPLKMWAAFTGQLLLRSLERAKRIHRAMIARGFDGGMHFAKRSQRITARDICFAACWCAIFACLRIFDISSLLGNFIFNKFID